MTIPIAVADTFAASLATPPPARVWASKIWAKALESAAAGVVREAVCFALCAFSLAFSVLLSKREILTLSLSLLLLILASVVLESTEGAMQKIYVASSDGSVSFPMDEAPSDRMWVLKIFLIPNACTNNCI